MISRQMQFASEEEMLFVEQAQGMFREMNARAEAAADGTVLSVIESVAMQRGRELTRRAIESTAQQDIERVEKKGRRRGRARAADHGTIAGRVRKES